MMELIPQLSAVISAHGSCTTVQHGKHKQCWSS